MTDTMTKPKTSKPAKPKVVAAPEARLIPVNMIDPNPDQPRREFEPVALQELADSILVEGLIQPITVRPKGKRFMIVAGERRWRAVKLSGGTVIAANVRKMDDERMAIQALVENAIRADVTPLEEAVAFGRLLDTGMTPEELAKRLGISQAWRITNRVALLALKPEYQALLRTRQLTDMHAIEMAKLAPTGQDKLFAMIRVGQCETYTALRLATMTLRAEERQVGFFSDDDKPTENERRMARGLEARFGQVVKVLRAATVDNEIVAVRKVGPDRASTLADIAAEMRKELTRIETALRGAAVAA